MAETRWNIHSVDICGVTGASPQRPTDLFHINNVRARRWHRLYTHTHTHSAGFIPSLLYFIFSVRELGTYIYTHTHIHVKWPHVTLITERPVLLCKSCWSTNHCSTRSRTIDEHNPDPAPAASVLFWLWPAPAGGSCRGRELHSWTGLASQCVKKKSPA